MSDTQDDDDMGAFWRDVKDARQQKRADNRENSAAMLQERGISFVSKNMGAHLIVTALGKTFDFWPGTGIWQERGDKRQHRGVHCLINACTPEKYQ